MYLTVRICRSGLENPDTPGKPDMLLKAYGNEGKRMEPVFLCGGEKDNNHEGLSKRRTYIFFQVK